VRGVPGDPTTRRPLVTEDGPARNVDERAVGGHGDLSGTCCCPRNALDHECRSPRELQPCEIECHGVHPAGDAVDQMAGRHVMRVAAAPDEFDVPVCRSSTAISEFALSPTG
jgi:hypothetical protein